MPTSGMDSVRADVDFRACFPALASETAFLENAGGTHVPRQVVRRLAEFLQTDNVQLGAGYDESVAATRIVAQAHRFLDRQMNAGSHGATVIGASTSQLLAMLAQCWFERLRPGDEIVLNESGHEANINPWLAAERLGARIRWWRVDPTKKNSTLDGLRECLTDRTRLVMMPHVSNLLGEINDVASAAELAHSVGAELVVDGVAYAPHGPVDVAAWGCDWYAFSSYKVFGPHMAALFGRHPSWARLEGPNHFFIPRDSFPVKFELGCQNHEGCAGILGVGDYMRHCLGLDEGPMPERTEIEAAWRAWQAAEEPLQSRLLEYLAGIPEVDVIGPTDAGAHRFGIVSFVHRRFPPAEIVSALREAKVACRDGHMYAYRLCEALGVDPAQGVVRISFVHYNTVEEADRAIQALDRLMRR